MSQGFVAQYAAEAALRTPGVAELEPSEVAQLKASLGVEHAGQGVEVVFRKTTIVRWLLRFTLLSILVKYFQKSLGKFKKMFVKMWKNTLTCKLSQLMCT